MVEDSGKSPARLPGIFKNDRIDSREFRKKATNITGLFQK